MRTWGSDYCSGMLTGSVGGGTLAGDMQVGVVWCGSQRGHKAIQAEVLILSRGRVNAPG